MNVSHESFLVFFFFTSPSPTYTDLMNRYIYTRITKQALLRLNLPTIQDQHVEICMRNEFSTKKILTWSPLSVVVSPYVVSGAIPLSFKLTGIALNRSKNQKLHKPAWGTCALIRIYNYDCRSCVQFWVILDQKNVMVQWWSPIYLDISLKIFASYCYGIPLRRTRIFTSMQ